MIQNISPEVFDNHFPDHEMISPSPYDTVFAYDGRTILVRKAEDGTLTFPSAGEVIARGHAAAELIYLFSIDEKHFFLFTSFDKGSMPLELEGYTYEKNSVLRAAAPRDLRFAAVTGYHLYVWYRDNRYCGRCGHEVSYSRTERALVCPQCGNTIYPRLNPAVIVGVTRGDSILMTRYAGREYKGHALVAGFCEIGETLEETVAREVLEEVGLHVHNIRYYKSQPWGFEQDLLAGFYCEADPDEEITLDKMELAKARFVPREEIGDEDADLSLTAEMIMRFRDGLE